MIRENNPSYSFVKKQLWTWLLVCLLALATFSLLAATNETLPLFSFFVSPTCQAEVPQIDVPFTIAKAVPDYWLVR